MLKVFELRQIFLEIKGFCIHLEGSSGLENNEIINLSIKLVETKLKEIKLGVDEKHVIDLPMLIPSSERLPPTSLTIVSGFA